VGILDRISSGLGVGQYVALELQPISPVFHLGWYGFCGGIGMSTSQLPLNPECQIETKHGIRVKRYRKVFCPTCNRITNRIGSIHLVPGDGWPVPYKVDYPCKCGHNDYEIVMGLVALTDGEADCTFDRPPMPKVKVKKVKGKHSKGLFDHLLKAKKRR
jgi:hypothetical protein